MPNDITTNKPEKKRSKREWVKTAAIIFLAVMLVLTFFSNTIMNWSLPEVSGQYAGWGEISTGIRGSGSVEANMAYAVKINSTREIKSVLVKRGDVIEAGQTIFLLDEADSEELKAAKELLESLQYDYSVKLIQTLPPDYAQTNKNIADMKEDLEKARSERAAIETNEAALKAAKQKTASAQKTVDDLTDNIADLEAAIAEIKAGSGENVVSSQNARQLRLAKTALADAEAALKIAESKREAAELDKKYPDENDQTKAKQAEIDTAVSELGRLKTELEGLTDEAEIAAKKSEISAKEREIEVLTSALHELQFSRKEEVYQQALEDVDKANIMVEQCSQNVLYYQNLVDKESSSVTSSLESQLEAAKNSLKTANNKLKAAQEAQAEAESHVGMTVDQADENIKNLERQLESAILDFQKQQKDDSVTSKLNSLEFEKARKAIADQQKVVDELSGTGEGSEVVSKYAGRVSSINVIAGDTAQAEMTLAEIDVDGKGYTLNIPVTNEQSQQVKVGDVATVSDNWWGNLEVTLAAIKTDPSNPGKGKILEFNVTGEAEVGQNLTVTVGNRTTSYNLVVPNSAVHEDANGTFILIAQAKSTPLGNRYIATRVDVKVIAKDNYNTAIDSGSDYGYDYVITTATKPVEAGTQVRLVENG